MSKFKKSTEAKYWEMLEILPPAYQTGYGFLVGEAMDHFSPSGAPRFTAFVEQPRGKFFESKAPMTVAEFQALKAADIYPRPGNKE